MSSGARKVYSYTFFFWWNASILTVMVVGSAVLAVTRTVASGPATGLPVLLFTAFVGVIGWNLLVTSLYRLELDATHLYWRRLGTEHAAPVDEVERVSGRGNTATISFRGDRPRLRVFIGTGFGRLVDDLQELNPSMSVDLSRSARMNDTIRTPFGGRYS